MVYLAAGLILLALLILSLFAAGWARRADYHEARAARYKKMYRDANWFNYRLLAQKDLLKNGYPKRGRK